MTLSPLNAAALESGTSLHESKQILPPVLILLGSVKFCVTTAATSGEVKLILLISTLAAHVSTSALLNARKTVTLKVFVSIVPDAVWVSVAVRVIVWSVAPA